LNGTSSRPASDKLFAIVAAPLLCSEDDLGFALQHCDDLESFTINSKPLEIDIQEWPKEFEIKASYKLWLNTANLATSPPGYVFIVTFITTPQRHSVIGLLDKFHIWLRNMKRLDAPWHVRLSGDFIRQLNFDNVRSLRNHYFTVRFVS